MEEEDLGEEGVGGGRPMSRFHQAHRWHLRQEITERQRERDQLKQEATCKRVTASQVVSFSCQS